LKFQVEAELRKQLKEERNKVSERDKKIGKLEEQLVSRRIWTINL